MLSSFNNVPAVLVLGAFLAPGAGCSANSDKSNYMASSGGSGGASADGAAGTNPEGGSLSDAPLIFEASTTTDSTELTDAQACTGSTATATKMPADIVILLDISGSMLYEDAKKTPKYDAVKAALTAFLQDPKSADLSVGLQYFPLARPGAKWTCVQAGDCGTGAPCTAGVCSSSTMDPDPENWIECTTNQGCTGGWGDSCAHLGVDVLGQFCKVGSLLCEAFPTEICLNSMQCDSSAYETLTVSVGPIATSGPAIVQSMGSTAPPVMAGTPTHPALQGVLNAARSNASANPSHTTSVLIATDGMPTSCDPNDIDSVAKLSQDAASGSPTLGTFVIGIFTDDDKMQGDPQANLDKIAAAGGTEKATIISASSVDVTAEFLAQLEKIRGSTLGCNYNIPDPPSGGKLDYELVNVKFSADGTSGQEAQTIKYVGTPDQCGDDGGWHYDVEPGATAEPTKIILCESTCRDIQNNNSARVDFALGCATVPK